MRCHKSELPLQDVGRSVNLVRSLSQYDVLQSRPSVNYAFAKCFVSMISHVCGEMYDAMNRTALS